MKLSIAALVIGMQTTGVSGTAGYPQQAGRKGFEDREQLWQQPAPGGYNLGMR
jgi:hypothetical protein